MKTYRTAKLGNEILRTYDLLLREWGIAFEETDVSTRYGKTHVITAGDPSAMPLVLFHGVGDDAALMWMYNAKALAEGYRIFAIDTLGGPGKSVPSDGYDKTFDDVLWIDEVLDGLGIQQAYFVGVSHGGYLTQLYALKRPERVKKGVCISSAVPAGASGSPMKTMMKIFLPEALFPTRRNIQKLLRKLSGDHAEVFTDNPLILAHYSALLKGFNNMAMGYHKVIAFTEADINEIRGKLLYLVGEKDPFQSLGGKKALEDHHMNAVWYPDAGHGLNHELAERVNERLLAYFSA